MIAFVAGLLMLALSLYLVYLGRRRPGHVRPAFMEWSGMEATIAMTATTLSILGLGLAGQAVAGLFG